MLWLLELVRMVSFPSSLEMYSWVLCSLPPRYTRVSALLMMPSQSSLNNALSWLMFCRMIVDMMFLERMVACKRA